MNCQRVSFHSLQSYISTQQCRQMKVAVKFKHLRQNKFPTTLRVKLHNHCTIIRGVKVSLALCKRRARWVDSGRLDPVMSGTLSCVIHAMRCATGICHHAKELRGQSFGFCRVTRWCTQQQHLAGVLFRRNTNQKVSSLIQAWNQVGMVFVSFLGPGAYWIPY
jgi:hypothetical protein